MRFNIFEVILIRTGQGISVGIATDYVLDGPSSNSGADEISAFRDATSGPRSLL